LDCDDRLGLLKPLPEPGVLLVGLGQFGIDGVGNDTARTTPKRFERGIRAGITLPAPVGQG